MGEDEEHYSDSFEAEHDSSVVDHDLARGLGLPQHSGAGGQIGLPPPPASPSANSSASRRSSHSSRRSRQYTPPESAKSSSSHDAAPPKLKIISVADLLKQQAEPLASESPEAAGSVASRHSSNRDQ